MRLYFSSLHPVCIVHMQWIKHHQSTLSYSMSRSGTAFRLHILGFHQGGSHPFALHSPTCSRTTTAFLGVPGDRTLAEMQWVQLWLRYQLRLQLMVLSSMREQQQLWHNRNRMVKCSPSSTTASSSPTMHQPLTGQRFRTPIDVACASGPFL